MKKGSRSKSKEKKSSGERATPLAKPKTMQPPLIPQNLPQPMRQHTGLFGPASPAKVEAREFNDDEPIDFKQPVKPDAMREQFKEVPDYDLEAGLSLYLKCRFEEIKILKQAQTLPAVLNIKTEAMAMGVKRPPFDLVCVLDHSGSMSGEKIKLLRQTLKFLLEQLNENDRICLIQFDDNAERMCPLIRGSPENKVRLLPVIESLTDRGGTSIASGMQLALKVLAERRYRNGITSVYLLTDGLDGSAIAGTKAAIDRAKITDPFSINCFGFGTDHDGNLMTAISDMKDGSFFYIEQIDTIDQAFATALGGLMSIVAQELNISIKNCCSGELKGLEVGKTYGAAWQAVGVTNGIKTSLIQLASGKEKGFVFDIKIPGMDKDFEKQKVLVLEAELVCKDRDRKKTVVKQAQLFLTLHPAGAQIDPIEDGEVMENYFRVAGAIAIEDAIQLADRGSFQEGQDRLEHIIQGIQKNKAVDPKKMVSLMEQIQTSKMNCSKPVYHSKKNEMLFMNKAMKCQKPSAAMGSMNMQEEAMYEKVKSKKCK